MDVPPEVGQAVPGAVGSAIALRWFPGPWPTKLAAWAAGTACAYFGAQFFAWYIPITSQAALGVMGFFCGLFGLMAIDKVQEVIKAVQASELWADVRSWIRKRLGVQ